MSVFKEQVRVPLLCTRHKRYGYSVEPIYLCETCNSYFCEHCIQDHRTFPPMRTHKVNKLPKYCHRCQQAQPYPVQNFAIAHCTNCQNHFCGPCLKVHDDYKMMNNHYVIGIEDYKGEV